MLCHALWLEQHGAFVSLRSGHAIEVLSFGGSGAKFKTGPMVASGRLKLFGDVALFASFY